MKHRIGKLTLTVLALLLSTSLAGAASLTQLQGKVHYLDQGDENLEQKMQRAARDFADTNREGCYFTGHIFTAGHGLHMGERLDPEVPYSVSVSAQEIRLRRTLRRSSENETISDREPPEPGPAGLLLLHCLSKGQNRILDAKPFDPEKSYRFSDTPIYWLGKADTDQSFALLTDRFPQGSAGLQNSLVFVISLHNSPQVGAFLQDAALGDSPLKVRKSAIFWLGNLKTPESFRSLKRILSRVKDRELKKQVVFAFSLSDEKQAVEEIIQIARQDPDQEVRKQAVFWLGQKASREALKALEEVVAGKDEDTEVKKSAVFAISQLPNEQSVPILISIAKSHPNAAVRKNAIFWLGQSGEEEAIKFFEDILLKK